MQPKRVNNSLLALSEQKLIAKLLPSIPATISPDHLTYLGFAGALLTGASLALCWFSSMFLTLALLGLFLNWFGDSFDGSLARHRSIERPRYGFLLDHSIDLVSTAAILLGLGISPFLPFASACLALITYLLFCGFVYIKVIVDGVHKLAFGGLGATEFRLLVAAWILIVNGLHLEGYVNASVPIEALAEIATADVIIAISCIAAVTGLMRLILLEASVLRDQQRVSTAIEGTSDKVVVLKRAAG